MEKVIMVNSEHIKLEIASIKLKLELTTPCGIDILTPITQHYWEQTGI